MNLASGFPLKEGDSDGDSSRDKACKGMDVGGILLAPGSDCDHDPLPGGRHR